MVENPKTYKDRYQRKNFISLCLSDREVEQVDYLALKLNLKRAAAIREIILTNSSILKKQINKNDNKEVLFLLSNIANNINQIAKKMNTNIDLFLSDNGEQFAFLFEDLISDFEKIKKELKEWYTNRSEEWKNSETLNTH